MDRDRDTPSPFEEMEEEVVASDEPDKEDTQSEEPINAVNTHNDSNEESGLEEEDRELIEENLGPIGFRRLQQRARVEGEGDDDDEWMERIQRKRVAPEELEKLFANEEEETVREQNITSLTKGKSYDLSTEHRAYESEHSEEVDDELADFIEEDEEMMDDDIGRVPVKKDKSKSGSIARSYLAEAFGSHLPMRVVKDILEIFGDGADYLGLVDDDQGEEYINDDIEGKDDEELQSGRQDCAKETRTS